MLGSDVHSYSSRFYSLLQVLSYLIGEPLLDS